MSDFVGVNAIADSEIDVDSPVTERLVRAYVGRDDWCKTSNPDGAVDAQISRYNSGHSHSGAVLQGKPIPTAGIANGGIWKAQYVSDGAIDASHVAGSTMVGSNFAANAIPADRMTGDVTTGLCEVVGIDSGDLFYDPIYGAVMQWVYTHSKGKLMLAVNPQTSGWIRLRSDNNSVTFGIADRLLASTWRVICDLM